MSKPRVSTAIDVAYEFDHLANAPIVEAVIEWRAEPTVVIAHDAMRPVLAQSFPSCSIQPLKLLHATIAGDETGVQVSEQTEQTGFRIVSEDARVVCQIRSNCVAVSRLEPYEGWNTFLPTARPFLQVFLAQFRPKHYSRLGVRFISRIAVEVAESAADVAKGLARPWEDFGLESTSFFQQDTLRWPGTAYAVRLVRALDERNEPGDKGSLFLDIDISLEEAVPLDEADQRLEEMRFLKNRIFFGTIKNACTRFK